MKRGFILLSIIFFIIPIAFADISITTYQNTYNLGNKIKASASILQNENFEGLFELAVSCGNYKLQYFLTPITLEANFRTAVNVPELIVTPSMLGNCTIMGNLVTNNNLIVDEAQSKSFGAANQLIVLPVKSKVTALPSESILVAGIVNDASGSNVLKASVKVRLDNNSYLIDAIDGKFNLTLEMLKNIKSGKHVIWISVSDQKLNSGEGSIELDITAVPSYIKLDLSSNQLLPGSKIGITNSLYDQADDLINASLDLDLKSPGGNKIFGKIVQSNEKMDYEFSQYAYPGIYVLTSAYKNLLAQASINMTILREVKIKYENENVFIENIGNVPFEDELTFLLESELKKYPITKKVNVEPGKILGIDLSKEVPLGKYDIKLPIKEGIEQFKEKASELVQNAIGQTGENLANPLQENEVLAGNVTIHDNRPVYKKIASGFASISGNLVGADGLLAKNPLIAPVVLLVIVLLVVLRYGRKPIMQLIRRKKDDEDKGDEI